MIFSWSVAIVGYSLVHVSCKTLVCTEHGYTSVFNEISVHNVLIIFFLIILLTVVGHPMFFVSRVCAVSYLVVHYVFS